MVVADSLDLGDEYVVYLFNSLDILIPRCKACFKSHATAELNSIDRIWHSSGVAFEIIQFSTLNLVRNGN